MNLNFINVVKTVFKELFKIGIDEVKVKEVIQEDTKIKSTYAKLAEEIIDQNIKEHSTENAVNTVYKKEEEKALDTSKQS